MSGKCPSTHPYGGSRCIRQQGHDGLCWSRASLDRTGAMTRGEWYSKDGEFKRHHQYSTSYTRAKR